MIHSLYALIIRLHPRRFRERFGAEMAATFEQAVSDGWGFRLLADGLGSLARQWLKVLDGSDRALHAHITDRPVLLDALRQRSIEALSRAWWLNTLFALALLTAYALGENWPVTLQQSPWLIVPVVLCIILILRTAPRLMDGPAQTVTALSLQKDPRVAQLQIERERLLKWSSSFILLLVAMAGMQSAIRVMVGFEHLDPRTQLTRLSMMAAVVFVISISLPRYRRLNRAVAQVLQNEIDAIRDVQSKRLFEDRF